MPRKRSRRSGAVAERSDAQLIEGIRRANQGIFVILPRDQASGVTEESQLFKTVRVVATVDYYLN